MFSKLADIEINEPTVKTNNITKLKFPIGGAFIPVEIGGNYCEIPWQDVLLSVRGNLDLITEKSEDGAAKIDRSASSKLAAENIQFLHYRNSFSMELGHSEWQKSYKIEN